MEYTGYSDVYYQPTYSINYGPTPPTPLPDDLIELPGFTFCLTQLADCIQQIVDDPPLPTSSSSTSPELEV